MISVISCDSLCCNCAIVRRERVAAKQIFADIAQVRSLFAALDPRTWFLAQRRGKLLLSQRMQLDKLIDSFAHHDGHICALVLTRLRQAPLLAMPIRLILHAACGARLVSSVPGFDASKFLDDCKQTWLTERELNAVIQAILVRCLPVSLRVKKMHEIQTGVEAGWRRRSRAPFPDAAWSVGARCPIPIYIVMPFGF